VQSAKLVPGALHNAMASAGFEKTHGLSRTSQSLYSRDKQSADELSFSFRPKDEWLLEEYRHFCPKVTIPKIFQAPQEQHEITPMAAGIGICELETVAEAIQSTGAESPQCDSLGWSGHAQAQVSVVKKFPRPARPPPLRRSAGLRPSAFKAAT